MDARKRGPTVVLAALIGLLIQPPMASSQELRGLWIDSWGNGILSAAQAEAVVNLARQNNFNAVFPEVRKVADSYYDSSYEPRADNIIDPPPYDPLAYLIDLCHDTSGGKEYIEVHAWLVTFRLWTSTPLPPGHVLAVHPEWKSLTSSGGDGSGSSLYLDPGHPDAMNYTVEVFLDVVRKYPDLDGIHFDYVRYPGDAWGYNPTSVARFNRFHGRSGQPVQSDPEWSQWRRDQVTNTVRKVYALASMENWRIKASAATIQWGDSNPDFTLTTPYRDVFQDWQGWMRSGYLDMNCLMNYVDEAASPQRYRNWSDLAIASGFGRQVVIGQGAYMNTVSNSMTQLLDSRSRGADGMMVYSHDSTNNEGRPNSEFYSALRSQVFTSPVPVPPMAWKASPDAGIFQGTVVDATGYPVDGCTVRIRELDAEVRTDGSGWYCFMDVPPGTYTLEASHSGRGRVAFFGNAMTAGTVHTENLNLGAGTVILLLSEGRAAFASTEFSPAESAGMAVDGVIDQANKWTNAGDSPCWWYVDLGRCYSLYDVTVHAAEAGGEPAYMNLRGYTLRASNSVNTTPGQWPMLASYDSGGGNGAATATFDVSGCWRYAGIHVTNAGIDAYARVPEIQVTGYEAGPGASLQTY